MSDPSPRERTGQIVCGGLAALVGLGVFAVRLHHAGPYAPPLQGNLRAALILLAVAAVLLFPGPGQIPRPGLTALRRAALLVFPVVLFFGFYAILAETEEVVTLRGTSNATMGQPLRLWIVDDAAGGPWVTMPREKAERNDLLGGKAELLRNGETSCVLTRPAEDPETIRRVFDLNVEKYRVRRLAEMLGLLPSDPSPKNVTIELLGCAAASSAEG